MSPFHAFFTKIKLYILDSADGTTTTILVVILFDDGIAQAKYLGCILRPARS